MLFAALLALRPSPPAPGSSLPGIVVADLVYIRAEADGAGQVADAEALAEEPAPPGREQAEPIPAGDPAPQPLVEKVSEKVSGLFSENRPDTFSEELPPEPAPEASVAESRPPAAQEPSSASVEETIEEAVDEAPPERARAEREAAVAVVPSAEAQPEPEPETTEIARAQRRMLDRRVRSWTAELHELDENELTWTHRGQEYTAEIMRSATDDSMGIEHVVVAVSTERDGSRWSTEMQLKRLAFSSFAQFVDRWDPNVQIHDDEIDGRFHSNTEIYISRSGGVQPAFTGKVTTAQQINTSYSTRQIRHADVFRGGLETRVRRIVLPKRFEPFASDDSVDPAQVHRFDADTRITFAADGSYVRQGLDPAAPAERVALTEEPNYLIAADGVSLHVRGVVNGKVLVHAPEDIVIEGDIVYAVHPLEDPGSDDFLGLVAERRVAIADPDTTGPGDLTVHAAIYAKRRFAVMRYTSSGLATLHVFGGVATGSLSATEPRFRTKLTFDRRLEDARPPKFPLTDRYELVAWDGLWTTAPVD